MKTIFRGLSVSLLALVAAGCSTPNPTALDKPDDVPVAFTGPVAMEAPIWPDANWWVNFKAEELPALEDTAQKQNLDLAAAAAGFDEARGLVESGQYDLVVLDELVTAVFFELVSLDRVLALMALKPAAVELVITGRRAPDELIAAADLATEMRPLKHYYDAGVEARPGIEF